MNTLFEKTGSRETIKQVAKFLLFAGAAVTLVAFEAHGEVLTVKQAIDLVKASNPDITSLRHQVDSAEAAARQALSPENPSVEVDYTDLAKDLKTSNALTTAYSITQPFAFPGKAFVDNAALRHTAKSLAYDLKSKELEISNTVKSAYYNLAVVRQDILLNAETKASYEKILALAKRRYEAGAISQVDVLNAEIAVYQATSEATDLATTERATLAQLNILLDKPIDQPIEVQPIRDLVKPLGKYQDAEDKMVAFNNDIKSAQETLSAAESRYTLAKMSLLPDFQFTFGATDYNTVGGSPLATPTAANSRTYFIGLAATIPLWAIFNQREGILGAAADKAAADADLASVKNQSRTDLKSTWESLVSMDSKMKTYENHLLGLSEQAYKMALVNYSSGKIDFQALSDAADSRNQIKHDFYDLVNSYLTGYSGYGQFIGEDL